MKNVRISRVGRVSGIVGGVLLAAGSVGVLSGWGMSTDAVASAAVIESSEVQSTREYEIDPTHTNIIFKIRHGSVSNFYGRFNETKGTINFDEDDITKSDMNLVVQMSSIDTNSRVRDGHLKGADFFNIRQFDEAKFQSMGIKENEDGTYELKGKFTLQGQTKVIRAELRDIRTGTFNNFDVLGVEAVFTIKRSDYGIMKYLDKNNPEGGPLGDSVEIIVGIEAIGK